MGGAFSQKDSPWYTGSSSWEYFGLGLLLRLHNTDSPTHLVPLPPAQSDPSRVRIYHGHQTGMEEEGFSHLDLTADPTHPEDTEELGFG
jgi:hypothetical protein